MEIIQKIWDFLVETYNRLFTGESPRFFRIWKKLSGIALLLTGLPAAITTFATAQKINLPSWVIDWGSNLAVGAAAFIALGLFIGSNFTTKTVTTEKMPLTKPTEEKEEKI